jgi:hypothetical protein
MHIGVMFKFGSIYSPFTIIHRFHSRFQIHPILNKYTLTLNSPTLSPPTLMPWQLDLMPPLSLSLNPLFACRHAACLLECCGGACCPCHEFAIGRFLHPLRLINLSFLNMQACHLSFTLTFYIEILQHFCIYKSQHVGMPPHLNPYLFTHISSNNHVFTNI